MREKRIKPGRDEKIITSWNGLMLAAFAEAAGVLGRDDYLEAAGRNARFVLDRLRRDGLLLHVYKDGAAKHVGFLEDYSFYAAGLLALYEAAGDARWLGEAVRLTEKMIEEFWDDEAGGFFYTGESGEKLIVRSKDYFDNATPSGNSVALGLLLRLSVLTGEEKYRRLATTVFRLIGDSVARFPSAFGYALCALDFYTSTPKEVVIVSPAGAATDAALAREVWKRYLPNKVVVQAAEGDPESLALLPLLRDRTALGGRATAYVCENYTCRQPVTDPEALAAQLDPEPSGDAASV